MNLDWELFAKIIIPIITSLVVAWITTVLAQRAKVVVYLSHAAGFNLPIPAEAPGNANDPTVMSINEGGAVAQVAIAPIPFFIHVHGIVIRNVGKKTAYNVRVGHNVSVNSYATEPKIRHEISRADDGSWEILIPTLVPNEQLIISYIYLPPITWGQIHSYTKSDEAQARVLNVLPTPQPPRWAKVLAYSFFYLGVFAAMYWIVAAIQAAYRVTHLIVH